MSVLSELNAAHKERVKRLFAPQRVAGSTIPRAQPAARVISELVVRDVLNVGSVRPDPAIAKIKTIIAVVCAHYGISQHEIKADRHARRYAWPRQVAIYLCCALTTNSLPVLGRFFKRDHTTALYSRNKVARLCAADPHIAKEIIDLEAAIKQEGLS